MPNRAQVTLQNVQSMNDLRTVFHLPINDAAKKLGLCVTVLKQKCREFGIVRWPFRKVKKIDTLIKQLEEEKEKVLSGKEETQSPGGGLVFNKEEGENSNAEDGTANACNEREEDEEDEEEKEEDEENNNNNNNNNVGGEGEERGGNGAMPTAAQKVLLEDIENRLQEILKMREELYADPNSNVHLLPNAISGVINSIGSTAEKKGESNNVGRSPSRQQAKAARATAAATAVQKHHLQLQEKCTENEDDDGVDASGAEEKKMTIAMTMTKMKSTEGARASDDADERKADVVQNDKVSLAIPEEDKTYKKKLKAFSARLWQRRDKNVVKSSATTPTRPTMKRQGSNSSSGKDRVLLFDALLDAATALDTAKKNADRSEQVCGDENNTSSDEYNWGRSNDNEPGRGQSLIGSPRKVRRSSDLQRSVRPASLDIPREKVLECRPNSVPLNINSISEADIAATFYQQMQLHQAQNAAAAAAAMQAAMATSMNPSQQSIPLMYQVPYVLPQYVDLNSKMMQMQWAEMNKNINASATAANYTTGATLLERRAAEAAASIGGGNVVLPSALDLKIPTAPGEGSTHSGAYFQYYSGMYSPQRYHHNQQHQMMMPMAFQEQSVASEGNSCLERSDSAEDKNNSRSGVATPTNIGAFPKSNRTSFEDQKGYLSPTSPSTTTATTAMTGIHRPLALKRGHLELQSNQFV